MNKEFYKILILFKKTVLIYLFFPLQAQTTTISHYDQAMIDIAQALPAQTNIRSRYDQHNNLMVTVSPGKVKYSEVFKSVSQYYEKKLQNTKKDSLKSYLTVALPSCDYLAKRKGILDKHSPTNQIGGL